MNWLRMVVSQLMTLFRKGRLEQELDEEVCSHVAMLVDGHRPANDFVLDIAADSDRRLCGLSACKTGGAGRSDGGA